MLTTKQAMLPATMLLCWVAVVTAATGSATLPMESLTVRDAVNEALQHNLSLMAARHGVDAARAEIITARTRPNPELEVETEFLSTRARRTGDTEYAVGAHFNVEAPGRRTARIRVAELGASATELELLDEVRMLVLEVQEAAVDVLLAKANLALAEENLAAFEQILTISDIRYRAGDIDGGELARTRLATMQVRNEVRAEAMELENVRRELALLLGRDPETARVDIDDQFRSAGSVPALEDLLATAISRRPDVAAAREYEALSAADLHLQQRERRPEFTVGTELRRITNDGNYVGVFFSIPLPIFDRNRGEISRARAEQLQAQGELRALLAQVQTQMRNGYARWQLSREVIGSLDRQMLEDARRVREIAEIAHRSGEAGLLEVLDANMAFNETMQAFNEARAEQARVLYLLDALTADTEY